MFAIALFLPGDLCPATSKYFEYDKWGDKLPNTVTLLDAGQPFPQTFSPGNQWIEA